MKRNFRKCSTSLYLLALMILVSCGGGGDVNFNIDGGDFNLPPFRNTDFKAEEPFVKDVEVGNRVQMRLKGVNGRITINGLSGATSVMITGMKRVKSDSYEDALLHLQELQINVQSLVNEIFVETIQPPDTGGRTYEVDYMITLPKDLAIRLANKNGIVTIDSIDNDVTVNNVNGDVTLMEVFGSTLVNLVNGTINGEVTLPVNGIIDLNTVNGNINLAIPVNTSAELSSAVTIGSISVSNLVLQNKAGTSTSLRGILGDGQGTIFLETKATGNISVSGF